MAFAATTHGTLLLSNLAVAGDFWHDGMFDDYYQSTCSPPANHLAGMTLSVAKPALEQQPSIRSGHANQICDQLLWEDHSGSFYPIEISNLLKENKSITTVGETRQATASPAGVEPLAALSTTFVEPHAAVVEPPYVWSTTV